MMHHFIESRSGQNLLVILVIFAVLTIDPLLSLLSGSMP